MSNLPIWQIRPLTVGSLFREAWRRLRYTQSLRERCVRYAVQNGARTGHEIVWEADRIATYILDGD